MDFVKRLSCIGLVALACSLSPEETQAQYAVVQPVVPGVVGYAAERRGLFGRRVVYRPVVAPVAAAVPVAPVAPAVTVARPVVTVARPVVTVARPVVTVARPVVTVARPVITQPVVAQPVVTVARPVVPAPVTTYYAPAPVTTYRVPIAPIVPVIGF